MQQIIHVIQLLQLVFSETLGSYHVYVAARTLFFVMHKRRDCHLGLPAAQPLTVCAALQGDMCGE